MAAKVNRMAGKFAQATPAARIWQIIGKFPAVMREYLCSGSEVCHICDVEGGGTSD